MDDYTSPQWESSALLTIDVQRDFTVRGASLCIPGTLEVLPVMRTIAEAYRRARLPIVHIVRLYESDGSNADLCRRAMIESGVRMASPGSQGSQLMEDLLPAPDVLLDPDLLMRGEAQLIGSREWIVYKPRFGAFYNTGLEQLLRRLETTTLVFAGCNFPNCPRTTIYEATERDFRAVIVSDAVSGLYERGIHELQNIGVKAMTGAEVVSELSKIAESGNRS